MPVEQEEVEATDALHGSQSTIELPDLGISDNFENITSDTLEKEFQVIPDHEGLG